jgi:glycosyltransferase involved in cell wall biosynthesis
MQWMIGPGGIAADLSRDGAFAQTLEQLASDGQQRQELGNQARQHCLAHFSRESVVDQILAYYQRVLRTTPCRTVAVKLS